MTIVVASVVQVALLSKDTDALLLFASVQGPIYLNFELINCAKIS